MSCFCQSAGRGIKSHAVTALVFTTDIPWPEGDEALSGCAREAVEALLTMEPDGRPKARG